MLATQQPTIQFRNVYNLTLSKSKEPQAHEARLMKERTRKGGKLKRL